MNEFTIVHLSDTHFLANAESHYGVTDTVAALESVLHRMRELDAVQLVVCTGDLSEDGSSDSYRRLAGIIEPWAAMRGAHVAYAMGNHDAREAFAASLLDGGTTRLYSSTVVDQTRVIVLDTSVPGAGYGRVDDEQLVWLADELSTPVAGGSVLVMHHAPVPAETTLLRALELQNPDAVWAVIRGSDVRIILAGHYHAALVEVVEGIPVVVAPAVTNQADIFTEPGTESAIGGSGGALVRLGARGARVLPFMVPVGEQARRIFHYDAPAVARIAELAGPTPLP